MKGILKKTMTVLSAMTLILCVTGCAEEGGASKSSSLQEEKQEVLKPEVDTSDMGPVLQRIYERGYLTVGSATGYAPYIFVDISSPNQEATGTDMELAKKVAEKLGVELKYVDMVFSGLISAVTTDKIDFALGGMTPTEERKESVDFSNEYLFTEQRVLVRKEDVDKFKTIDDLNGATIAIQKSTTQDMLATDFCKDSTIIRLDKVPNAILELTSKNADVVIIEEIVAQQYIIENNDLTICEIEFPEERKLKTSSVAFKKGNEDFIKIVNEVIAECEDEGAFDEWVTEYSQLVVDMNK